MSGRVVNNAMVVGIVVVLIAMAWIVRVGDRPVAPTQTSTPLATPTASATRVSTPTATPTGSPTDVPTATPAPMAAYQMSSHA